MRPLLLLLALAAPHGLSAAPRTPAPGSPERVAIADAMRAYVAPQATRKLPQKLVFKIEFLRVDGDYAGFGGFPIFEDGSDAIPDYMPDIVYCTVLRRDGDRWKVILDLSRTDVPDEAELRQIRARLPKGVPPSVLTDFWRPLLSP